MNPRAYILLIGGALAYDDPGGPDFEETVSVSLELVVRALSSPVFVTAPPGDGDHLLARTRPRRNGSVEEPPFLDIGASVSLNGGERGLLGLAFHPGYATNGRFHVNYTDTRGHTQGRPLERSRPEGGRAALPSYAAPSRLAT